MGFDTLLRLINEGDPVRAGVVNRPLRQTDQNARYLWDVLQAAAIGSTVYAHSQPLDPTVKPGMAVYLNPTTQRFEAALAVAVVDQVTGVVATAASSQVWGIVASKRNAGLADILLYGLDTVNISQATVAAPAAGTYYLSSAAPGMLTQAKPPISVAVLRRTPDGRVFVMPQFVDYLDRHTHYRFALVTRPAGTSHPPGMGGIHAITDADATRPGWLPAADPSFLGKAPVGAEFGYNLVAHPALKAVWPPVPLSNAALEWDKGLSIDVGATGVPLGRAGLCVLDANGIWWMSNCYGDVPWPIDYDTGHSTSFSDSSSAECPRHLNMALTLYFTRVDFATDSTVVLSLASRDARIKVRCVGDPTRAAATGNLEISLDLNLTVTDDQAGYLALKEFDPATTTFARGPVAEAVYARSPNVTLTGDKTSTRTIGGVPRTVYQGLVGITVNPADTKELDVELVRLDGVEEAFVGTPPLMYLEFPAGDESEIRGKIEIPIDLAIASPELALRFWILGRASGTLPQLTFSARRAARPTAGLVTPVGVPADGTEFSVTCVTVATLTGADQYVEAVSSPFGVAPGDTVFYTVRRSASDGYAGDAGIFRQGGTVLSGA